MTTPLPPSAWVSIGIAIASLIIVPVGGSMVRKFFRALREAKAAEMARLLEPYVRRSEHDERADRVEKATGDWREEQREMFNTIRTEAYQREQLIVNRLDQITKRVDDALMPRRHSR